MFASSKYYRDPLLRRESQKQAQREELLHILSKIYKSREMVFTGLPGAEWRFEHMLADKFGRRCVRINGLERNQQILLRSVRFMPGSPKKHRVNWVKPCGKKLRGFASTVSPRNPNRALCVRIEDLAASVSSMDELSVRAAKQWRRAFFSNTVVWADLFSPLGYDRTIKLLANANNLFDPRTRRAIFILTIYNGHDDPEFKTAMQSRYEGYSPVEQRSRMAKSIIEQNCDRRVDILEVWGYRSMSGHTSGNMATIVMALRK